MSSQSPSDPNIVNIDPSKLNESHFFKISFTLEQDRKLDIKPLYISLGLEPSAFESKLGGTFGQEQNRFAKPKSIFDTGIRGSGIYADRYMQIGCGFLKVIVTYATLKRQMETMNLAASSVLM